MDISIIQDLLSSAAKDFIQKKIKGNQWKKLFTDTSELLTSNINSDVAFQKDLQAVFSEENMKEIAGKTEDANGYELIQKLKVSVQKLMMQYEIPEVEAATYTDHFVKEIISYIRETDPQKAQEIFLADWFTRYEQDHMKSQEKLEL